MILAAFGIFGYNQYEDQSVQQQNEVILETLETKQTSTCVLYKNKLSSTYVLSFIRKENL